VSCFYVLFIIILLRIIYLHAFGRAFENANIQKKMKLKKKQFLL